MLALSPGDSAVLVILGNVMCLQKRRLEVAAAADERAQRVRAAHQAKLARAEQLAALVQQKKVEQTVQLKERSKLVAMRNEEVHHKRLVSHTHIMCLCCCAHHIICSCFSCINTPQRCARGQDLPIGGV